MYDKKHDKKFDTVTSARIALLHAKARAYEETSRNIQLRGSFFDSIFDIFRKKPAASPMAQQATKNIQEIATDVREREIKGRLAKDSNSGAAILVSGMAKELGGKTLLPRSTTTNKNTLKS